MAVSRCIRVRLPCRSRAGALAGLGCSRADTFRVKVPRTTARRDGFRSAPAPSLTYVSDTTRTASALARAVIRTSWCFHLPTTVSTARTTELAALAPVYGVKLCGGAVFWAQGLSLHELPSLQSHYLETQSFEQQELSHLFSSFICPSGSRVRFCASSSPCIHTLWERSH